MVLLLAEPSPPDEYADEFCSYLRRHTMEASDGEYTFRPWPIDGFRSTTALRMPLHRVKRRRVPDTRETGSGSRLWPGFRPRLNTKIECHDVTSSTRRTHAHSQTEKRPRSSGLGVRGGPAHVDRSFALDRRTGTPTHWSSMRSCAVCDASDRRGSSLLAPWTHRDNGFSVPLGDMAGCFSYPPADRYGVLTRRCRRADERAVRPVRAHRQASSIGAVV